MNALPQPCLGFESSRLVDVTEEAPEFAVKRYPLVNLKAGKVVIDGKEIAFKETALMNGKLRMILPEDFRPIPTVQRYYQSGPVPDLLLTDASGVIQLAMTHLNQKVSNDTEVTAYQYETQQLLKRTNPSIEWLLGGVKDISGRQIGFYEFIIPLAGTGHYQLSFFLELEQRILSGNFVCTDRKLRSWKTLFYQMLGSLRVITSQDWID
ncbi:MAG TPA: hypothetical protein VIM29_01315 [Bacillota bacterium]